MVDLRRAANYLDGIYGPARTPAVLERLSTLCHRYEDLLPKQAPARLSEADSILISYPDQVKAPGKAPLACLSEFADSFVGDSLTGIHVLPFFPSSSDDGFAVKDYRSVDPSYGTWEDIRALGSRYRLMFDAVINHTSTSSAWFQGFLGGDPEYADYFIRVAGSPDLSRVVRPRTHPLLTPLGPSGGKEALWTTFGPDQVDLNYGNPDVLLEVIDLLLYYVAQGATIIRLDAIAYLWKDIGTTCIHCVQTHLIVKLFRTIFDGLAPQASLMTETNVPQEESFAYFGDGSDEAQLVYNFPLAPLILQAFHSGGAGRLTAWAESLDWPADGATYFNILASHDGIGLNPARGILTEAEIDGVIRDVEATGGLVSSKRNPDGTSSPYEINANYFDALSRPGEHLDLDLTVRRFLTAHAILLAFRGLPGIYFHSLVGSRGWPQGVRETGRKRTVNRQKLDLRRLAADLAEPRGRRAQIHAGLRRLLQVRRTATAFSPWAAQRVLPARGALFALVRGGDGPEEEVLCIHNVSTRAQPFLCDSWSAASSAARVEDLISGQMIDWPQHGKITVAPFQSLWLIL
jgi:glycosidase